MDHSVVTSCRRVCTYDSTEVFINSDAPLPRYDGYIKVSNRFRLAPKSTTLDGIESHYARRFKTHASFGTHHENLNEDPHYQQRRCSPMTLVCDNIISCGYSSGFSGEGVSNNSGVIKNFDFQGFRTLRLRHLMIWGQNYYMLLFRPLSPFHWPQNTWPWMTLKSWLAILR